jgi:hypothetical protein
MPIGSTGVLGGKNQSNNIVRHTNLMLIMKVYNTFGFLSETS